MSDALSLLAWAAGLALLVDALRRVDLRALAPLDRRIWAALTVSVLGARAMTIGLPGLPELGFQGAAFLAITLGYCRALVSLALVFLLTVPLAAWGAVFLAEAVLPVWCTCALVSLIRRFLPPNLFVFLLGVGFFAVFAVGVLQLGAVFGLDALIGDRTVSVERFREAFAYGLLLLGGEATLVGMVLTVLVVYVPRAVALFDERHYLSSGRTL